MPPPMTTTCAAAGMLVILSETKDPLLPPSRTRLAQLERGDAGDHAGGAGEPWQAEAFLEPERAHQRREKNRSLAQCSDGGHRRASHRPQHDAVRSETARAADESPRSAGAHVVPRGLSSPRE